MKTMKKVFALLLAAVMVMGLSITAFATETDPGTPTTGSITVENADASGEYVAYKIFDVSYSGDNYAYSISKDSAWLDTIITYIGSYTKVNGVWYASTDVTNGVANEGAAEATEFKSTTKGLTLTLSANGGEYVVKIDKDVFSAADFAKALNSALYGYSEVTAESEFDDSKTYYIKSGSQYVECAGLTAFEDGKTYYTRTATELLNKVVGKPLTKDEDGKVSVTELSLGYYFVTSTVGSLADLTTTNPDVTIYDKNEQPPFDKTVNDEDVEIGQTVNYTITGKVPSTTGYTKYDYTVSDTLSSGLTFNKDVKVTFGGSEQTVTTVTDATATLTDGQIRYTDTGFELYFDMTRHQGDEGSSLVGKTIIITYSAVVNENAVVTTEGNPNNATLEYSNDPNDTTSTDTETDVEKVYTVKLTIDKYAKNANNETDTSKKLSGAEFVLVKKDTTADKETFYQATVYAYTYKTKVGEETVTVTVYSKDGADYYTDIACTDANKATLPEGTTPTKGAVADVSWVESIDDATKVTTNANGAATFDGLEAGTYYLRETKAPDGYNLLTEDTEINIVRTEDSTTKTVSISGDTAAVANSTGTQLPSTGGIGTTIFYIIGGILVVGAAILLITKKRMSSRN